MTHLDVLHLSSLPVFPNHSGDLAGGDEAFACCKHGDGHWDLEMLHRHHDHEHWVSIAED